MPTQRENSSLNPAVFYGASVSIVVLLLFAVIAPQQASDLFSVWQQAIVDNGSWFYVLTVAIVLLVTTYVAVSRHGDVKLGPDHAKPHFSLPTWLSMLFAAGMGIGLMFFGVAEPLMHYQTPPTATPETVDAMREAMKTTFFHWGFHAWGIYAIVALLLGYFAYRHELPLTLRSALYPLLGDRIYGWIGHTVDAFAVISTIFGVSTSLGFGAAQINAGLNYVIGLPISTNIQIMLMVGVIGIAVVSVTTGLDKGIRRLSEANMLLAIGLLLFVLVLGPSVFLLQAYLQNTGAYLADIVRNTFNLFAYEQTDWIGGWTIFYWGWWLAWAPFVGLFIARISYGRTLREFVLGVMLIPTAFTLLWMTVFGNSAIELVANQGQQQLAQLVNENTAVALFVFLEQFPFAQVLSVLAVLMVVIFFVTSCDSGAMVVDMLCSYGRNDTPLWQRIYWAVGVGVVAAVLLWAGGLGALQTMTIVAALPFAIVLLIAIVGLLKALRVEHVKRESLQVSTLLPPASDHKGAWQERLKTCVEFPQNKRVVDYIAQTVHDAQHSVKSELAQLGFSAAIEQHADHCILTVDLGTNPAFIYAVYATQSNPPDFSSETEAELDSPQVGEYYRAEVHLSEGGQGYDIMGWSKLAVINDIVDQFQKHQHFIYLLGSHRSVE